MLVLQLRAGVGCGTIRERNHLEDLSVDGMIMLKWILQK